MKEISWHKLQTNSQSKELSFESFNFQIAYKKYSKYGSFEYDYNTPGSEFYLTLKKDCEELDAKTGDVIGWQVKFWVDDKDFTSFGADHRDELKEGFETSLNYRKNLTRWIICTPGPPNNTEPHKVKDKLINELKSVSPHTAIGFWNRPIYEGFYHETPDEFSSIYAHYFSDRLIGIKIISEHTTINLKLLHEKYDTDLYTEGQIDETIDWGIDLEKSKRELLKKAERLSEVTDDIIQGNCYGAIAINYFNEEYIRELGSLLSNLLALSRYIINGLQECETKDTYLKLLKYIQCKREEAYKIIKDLDTSSAIKNPNQMNYSFEEEKCHEFLVSSINSISGRIEELTGLIFCITRNDIHVLGKAGSGKTNIACAICEKFIKRSIPALLILGSGIRNTGIPIKKQILDKLSVENTWSFDDFLGALDNLGFLRKIKVPIIIDGLNETTPTSDNWTIEINHLVESISKYDYIILITTCREIYIRQIFEKKNHKDVSNSLYLEGFDDSNIGEVIEKYFHKYDITVTNPDFDREIFKNPLLLKVFSIAYQGKCLTFTHINIYQALEEYISRLSDKISTKNNFPNPILRNRVESSINQFAQELWETNDRCISYPEKFCLIFDPDNSAEANWLESISHKIIDEGLFITRNMYEAQECAEFTYDLLAGFCIARAVVFAENEKSRIVGKLKSKEFLDKLINDNDPSHNHPLHEDIINAIIYLLPKYTKLQLFEILDNKPIITYCVSAISLIISTCEGKRSFSEFVKGIQIVDDSIPNLLDVILLSVIKRNDYAGVSILVDTMLRMSSVQIDLIWSELIRKNSRDIIDYLMPTTTLLSTVEVTHTAIERICIISSLLSSTNRLLRDMATKALVMIGIGYPSELFQVFKILESINDIYILERVLASLCGVVIRIERKELILEIADYLEKNYFKKLRTTHALILDYVDTLLDYASHEYGLIRDIASPDSKNPTVWKEDELCRAELVQSKSVTWGYGPIRMDFANYIIGHIASQSYSSESRGTPNLAECIAMIVWRMKVLGYSEESFQEIDNTISSQANPSRFDNSMIIERYGKKYSWIAFFELYGHFLISKLMDSEYDSGGFRISRIDIDPTFPQRSSKIQLVTDCFLPENDESLQDWINTDRAKYFEQIYVTKFEDDPNEWILLNAFLKQGIEDCCDIYIYVDAVFVKDNCDEKESSSDSNLDFSSYHIPEFFYLFAGEIPWSKNLYKVISVHESCGEEKEFYSPFFWYSWESYHSMMNDLQNVPIPSKDIASEFGLNFNISDLCYHTKSGEIASKYIWDDYSRFLFLRMDLLNKFMKKNRLSLIWNEYGSKSGKTKKGQQPLEPPSRRFKSVKKYDINSRIF